MTLKAILAVVAAAAIAVGFALPAPHGQRDGAASQIAQLEVQR
jgi:hypothetical protein